MRQTARSRAQVKGAVKCGRLYMIDLAGSERASQTEVSAISTSYSQTFVFKPIINLKNPFVFCGCSSFFIFSTSSQCKQKLKARYTIVFVTR